MLMGTEYPPDWDSLFDCLAQMAAEAGERSPVAEMDFVTCCAELDILFTDARPYIRQFKPSWKSTISDLVRSKSWLGPRLRVLVDERLDRLLYLLRDLNLSRVSEVIERKPVLARASGLLLEDIAQADAGAAAWRDLSWQIENDGDYLSICRSRDVLAGVLGLHGHNMDRHFGVGSDIRSVLLDRSGSFHAMRRAAGAIVEVAEPDNRTIDDWAGAPRQARLQVVERYLRLPISVNEVVVWLVYEECNLGDVEESLGQLSFFRLDWLRELMRGEAISGIQLVAELVENPFDFSALTRFSDEGADDAGIVVIRAGVGKCHESQAIEAAKTLVELVLAASFGASRSGWNHTGSALVFANGQPRGSSWRRPEGAVKCDWREMRALEVAAAKSWLPEGAGSIEIDSELSWTVDAIRAVSSSSNSSPSARLAMAVQAIERVNATTVNLDNWASFVSEYLQSKWVSSQITDDFLDAAIYAASSRINSSSSGAEVSDAARRIRNRQFSGPRDPVDYASEMIQDSRVLLNELAPGSYAYRRLVWHARLLSFGECEQIVQVYSDSFEHMLDRCIRYRNASVHGAAQSPETLLWTSGFARRVASIALSWKIVSHIRSVNNVGPIETMNHLRGVENWRLNEIRTLQLARSFGGPQAS